jgi:hypothetical protein
MDPQAQTFPISKYPHTKLACKDFAQKWRCFFRDPPADGDKIFALVIADKVFERPSDPSEKEYLSPFVGYFQVQGDKAAPHGSFSLFYLDPGMIGEILTQSFSAILWLKEDDYWQFAQEINQTQTGEGWLFVKDYEGTHEEALAEALRLQAQDPQYRYYIWDNR